MKRFFLLLVVLFAGICAFALIFSPSGGKPASDRPKEEVSPSTASVDKKLGDRLELVQHFEYVYKMKNWKHITSNNRDIAVGGSSNGDITIGLSNDPVDFAQLAIVTSPTIPEDGAQVLLDFWRLTLPSDALKWANGPKGEGADHEKTIGSVHIKIYYDALIKKMVFQITWLD